MSDICRVLFTNFYKLCLIWVLQFYKKGRADEITPTFKDETSGLLRSSGTFPEINS